MSVQITTAFVEQYRGEFDHLLQQKGSRLRGAVRTESVTGKNAFFEQIGSTAAQVRTSRHSDTPRMDTPHARRRVSLSDYDWADLIDDPDRVRMLIEPSNAYAMAAMWAMGRAMDDVIIAAADGTAFTGVAGGTSTVFDTAMIVDVQVRDPGVSAADYGMNVAKLIQAKELLDAGENDPDEDRFIALPARQVTSLLKTTKATSSDYAAVKALVEGKIDSFMGFKFIRTQRTGVDSNSDDKCLFWVKSGLLLAIGQNPQVDIGPRRDKNNSTQVFVSMTLGCTRMEEGKVGYIECDDDAGPGA
mgnify:CR=1 FL=1